VGQQEAQKQTALGYEERNRIRGRKKRKGGAVSRGGLSLGQQDVIKKGRISGLRTSTLVDIKKGAKGSQQTGGKGDYSIGEASKEKGGGG